MGVINGHVFHDSVGFRTSDSDPTMAVRVNGQIYT